MNGSMTETPILRDVQNTSQADALVLGGASGHGPTLVLSASDVAGGASIPNTALLQYGSYQQSGADLVITGPDGSSLVVQGYFDITPPPALQGPDGFVLQGSLVSRLAGVAPQVQVAEVGADGGDHLAQAASEIGSVGKLSGTVTVTRADGTEVTLSAGDPVYQGDILMTADGASVGIVFVDGTEMSLGSQGRLVLDEMIYDPGTGEGNSSFSLMSGAFSFVSGQIAKTDPDGMMVKTPVATIGIRGTSGTVKIGDLSVSGDSQLQVVLIPDPGGSVGEIIVTTSSGQTSTINVPFNGVNLSAGSQGFQSFTISANDFVREYGTVINSLNSDFSNTLPTGTNNSDQNGQPGDTGPQDGGEPGAAEPGSDDGGDGEVGDQSSSEGEGEGGDGQTAEDQAAAMGEDGEQQAADGEGAGVGADGIPGTEDDLTSGEEQAGQFSTEDDDTSGPAKGQQTAGNGADRSSTDGAGAGTGAEEDDKSGSSNSGGVFESSAIKVNYSTSNGGATTGASGSGGTGSSSQTAASGGKGGTASGPASTGETVGGATDKTGKTGSGSDSDDEQDNSQASTDGATGSDGADGSDGSDGGETGGSTGVTTSGAVVDPYVSGATVFLDYDNDRILDSGEPFAITDANGNYTLTGSSAAPIVSIGGVDTSTGVAVGTMVASEGGSIVSPLTTLINAMVANGTATDSASAEASLKTSLGIDPSVDLTTYDPVAGTSQSGTAGETAALVLSVSVMVQNVLSMVSATLEGAGASSDGASSAAASALASALASGSRSVLTSSSDVSNLITNAAADSAVSGSVDSGKVSSAAGSVATAIVSVSNSMETVIGQGNASNLLDQLNGVARVAQRDAANDIQTSVSDGNSASLSSSYSQSSVNSKSTQAQTEVVPENIITGSSGADTLTGTSGGDQIYGKAGNDIINGGDGVDWLYGEGGNDTFIASAGNDTLYGSSGTDKLDMSGVTAAITANLASGTVSSSETGTDILSSVEWVVGGSGNDSITGSSTAEILQGGAGDDTITGGGGADALSGGEGTDTLNLSADTSGVSINLTSGNGTVSGAAVTLSSFERVVGGSGNDSILGSAGADTLLGGAGDDVMGSGGGADTLDGGAGTDTLSFADQSTGISANMTTGVGTIGGTTFQFSSFEALVGSSGGDSIVGSAGADRISGAAGDDVIAGGGGADTLDGGVGADTLSFADQNSGVTVSLGAGSYTLGGATASFSNFENLAGSDYGDTLSGDSASNTIFGGLGDDTLGLSGGKDVFEGGDGLDTLDLSADSSGVTLNLTNGTGSAFGDTIQVISVERVVGSAGNDSILGSAGADTLLGGAGDDVMGSGGGADTLDGGAGTDTLSFADQSTGISANMTTGVGTIGGTTFQFSSFEALVGSSGGDSIVGSAGADRISGAAGNDVIAGGGGADTLDGGAGADTLSFADQNSGVTISLGAGSYTLGGATASFSNFENLAGSDYGDTLSGNSASNTIFGGLGDDTLILSGGSDLFDGGQGTDTLDLSADTSGALLNLTNGTGYALGAFLSVTSIERVVGSAVSDSILGSAGADTLLGGGGDDVMSGGGGADTLDGGAGSDILSFADQTTGITASLAAGSYTLGGATSTFSSFENLQGGDGNDLLSGDSGDNSLIGGAGDDSFTLSAGNDTLFGGTGTDTLDLSAESLGYNVDMAAGTATEAFASVVASTTSLNSIEKVIGSSSSDLLVGSASAETLIGGAGDDTIFGGGGADVLDGGDGNDTLDLTSDTGGAVVDLTAGTANLGGATASVTSFETVLGGAGNDTIRGSTGDDDISGGAGNDVIAGGGGYDSLDGGDGADTLSFADYSTGVYLDAASSYASVGGDSVTFSNFETYVGGSGDDTLRGTSGDDVIIGGDGNDVIEGSAGNDSLSGGAGDDTYFYSSGDVVITDSAGSDTLSLGSAYMRAVIVSGSDLLISTSLGTITLVGQADETVIETIIGGSGDDIINNQMIADVLKTGDGTNSVIAGVGVNTFIGGDTLNDVISFASMTGSLDLNVAAGTATVDGQTFGISGFERVTGTDLDDIMVGDATANTFSGGAGDDTVDGGAGDDLYYFTSGDDTYTDSAGTDSLNAASVTFEGLEVVGDDVVITTSGSTRLGSLGGSTGGTITLTDQALGVAIENIVLDKVRYSLGTASADADILYAVSDSDTLSGQDGNDILVGGDGYTAFDDGAGDDRILLNHGDGSSVVISEITAGAGSDTLVCSTGSGISFDSVMFIDGGLAALQLSNGNQVYLNNAGAGLEFVELGSTTYSMVTSTTGGSTNDLMVLAADDTTFLSQTSTTVSAGDGNDILLLGAVGSVDLSWTAADGSGGLSISTSMADLGYTTVDMGLGDDVMVLGGALNGASITASLSLMMPATLLGGAGTDTLRVGSSFDLSYSTISGFETLEVVDQSKITLKASQVSGGIAITGDGTGTLEIGMYGASALDLSTATGIAGATISAGETSDVKIIGSSGDDTISVYGGTNSLDGGAGSDVIEGGMGDDVIVYDAADSTIDGGAGTDTVVVNGAFDMTTVSNLSNVEGVQLNVTDGSSVVVSSDWIKANTSGGVLYLSGSTNGAITGESAWEYSYATSSGSVKYDIYSSAGAELWVDSDSGLDLSTIIGTDPGTGAVPVLDDSKAGSGYYYAGGMIALTDIVVQDDASDSLTLVVSTNQGTLQSFDDADAVTITGAGTTSVTLSGSQADLDALLQDGSLLVDTTGAVGEVVVSYAVEDSDLQTASMSFTYTETTDAAAMATIGTNAKVDVGTFSSIVAMESGDLNGDGFDDLVIQREITNAGGDVLSVQSEVLFGSEYGQSGTVDTSASATGTVGLITDMPFTVESQYSTVIGIADMNGDGYDDLIVSENYGYEAYMSVLFGGSSVFEGTNTFSSIAKATVSFHYNGLIDGYYMFGSGAVGDLNGDGFADTVIASTYSAVVVFGSDTLTSQSYEAAETFSQVEDAIEIDGILTTAVKATYGAEVITAVDLIDITGDGVDDLVVTLHGTPFASSDNTNRYASIAVFDGTTVTQGGTVQTEDATWRVIDDGDIGGVIFGSSVGGDFNGDGIADLAYTLRNSNNDYVTKVVLGASGAAGTETVNRDGSDVLTFSTALGTGTVNAGVALASGDLDGDGTNDLIICVDYADAGANAVSTKVYVLAGGGAAFTASGGDLATLETAGAALSFDIENNNEDISISTADLDGDGFDEIVLTQYSASQNQDVLILDRDTLIDRDVSVNVGTAGNDTLTDTTGDDIIVAGAGADTIISSQGADTVNGGNGVDVLSFAGRTSGVTVAAGARTFTADGVVGRFKDIEVISGSDHADTLMGSVQAETMIGGLGDDTISGLGGADVLDGGAGNDTIVWSDDAKTLAGGDGSGDLLLVSSNGAEVSLEDSAKTSVSGFEYIALGGTASTLSLTALSGTTAAAGEIYVTGQADSRVVGDQSWVIGTDITLEGATYTVLTNRESGVVAYVQDGIALDNMLDPNVSGLYVANDITLVSGASTSLTGIELGDDGGAAGTGAVSLTLSVATGTLSVREALSASYSLNPAGDLIITGTLAQVQELIDSGNILYTRAATASTTLDVTFVTTGSVTLTSSSAVTVSNDLPVLTTSAGESPGAVLYSDEISTFKELMAGDFNGDGIEDLVIVDQSNQVSVVLGDAKAGAGAGHLSQAITLTGLTKAYEGSAAQDFSLFAVGDITGDGIDDIVLSTTNSGLLVAEGSHALTDEAGESVNAWALNALSVTPTTATVSAIVSGDFNGDGADDIILNAPDAATSTAGKIFYGNGFETGADMASLTISTSHSIDLGSSQSMGDMNRDGFDDLVWNGSAGSVHVMAGNNFGSTTATTITWSGITSDIAVDMSGDLNGDGYDDLILVAQTEQKIQLIEGGRSGIGSMTVTDSGTVLSTSSTLSSFADSVATGDFNGDGLDDIAIFSVASDGVKGVIDLVFGQETLTARDIATDSNSLHFTVSDAAGVIGAGGLLVSDTNGDGFDDLMVAGVNASDSMAKVSLLLGNDALKQADYVASSAGGSFAGTANTELIIGGSGNDTLTGNGLDTINAGAGDDHIVVASSHAMNIDGGTGQDNVVVNSNLSLGNIDGWENIDGITLSGSTYLFVDAENLKSLADGVNELIEGYGVDEDNAFNMVVISGDATDTVELGTDLTFVENSASLGSSSDSYTVYQESDSGAKVYIDSDISIATSMAGA